MATNWRIYGKETIACKLSKAELPGFFQKKITVGPQEAALIVKNGKIQDTVTQTKEVVLGFWERLKSGFGIDTDVDVYVVDMNPLDLVIYLGKIEKTGTSSDQLRGTGTAGPVNIVTNKNENPPRAAGVRVDGQGEDAFYSGGIQGAMQAQRDTSSMTLLALSSDKEIISAECRLKVSISLNDVTLLSNALKGRAALSTWDITGLIKDELLAKVLIPRIAKIKSDEFRGNRELLATLQTETTLELRKTFSIWGLLLDNFVINWGLTELDLIELDKKKQNREEDALKFTHQRHLADMQRNLEIETTHLDNLRQLKIAEARGDEDLKAYYLASEVDRANIFDGKRLNIAKIDSQIAILQLDIKRRDEEIKFEFEKRRKELDADIDQREMQSLMSTFNAVQAAKRERQKQEQEFMTQQMNIQTGSIERLTSQGIDKGVVDGSTIQEIARQYTAQRALDRTDAKVDSMSHAETAKNNVNIFKDAEDRERKHQVDMTGQSSQMMESAKQNVPHTLVQGSGITPNVRVSVPSDQPVQPSASVIRCHKCDQQLQPGAKFCPECGEPVFKTETKCSCGASIEKGWKFCSICGKPTV